jgi:hypothetical protein
MMKVKDYEKKIAKLSLKSHKNGAKQWCRVEEAARNERSLVREWNRQELFVNDTEVLIARPSFLGGITFDSVTCNHVVVVNSHRSLVVFRGEKFSQRQDSSSRGLGAKIFLRGKCAILISGTRRSLLEPLFFGFFFFFFFF